jgi:hypothetical protein
MLLLVSIFVELLQATGMVMLPLYVYSIVASQGNRMVCKYLSAESMSQTPWVPLLYSHLVRQRRLCHSSVIAQATHTAF